MSRPLFDQILIHAAKVRLNATVILSMIQITVHISLSAIETISKACLFYFLGCTYAPQIRFHYQYHRLIGQIFLHSGATHLLSNLLTQVLICYPLENEISTPYFLIIYIASGIIGALFSIHHNPGALAVGASGAIFGLIGYKCAYHFKYGFEKTSTLYLFSIIMSQVFVLADSNSHIDVAAHIGGFIAGLLFFMKQNLMVLALGIVLFLSIFLIDITDAPLCRGRNY